MKKLIRKLILWAFSDYIIGAGIDLGFHKITVTLEPKQESNYIK